MPTPERPTRADVPAPLFERGREVEAITRAVRSGARGDGQMLLIEGPSGIGKSRLLTAAHHIGVEVGAEVLTTCGGELEQDFPLGLVLRLLETRLTRATSAERDAVFRGHAALAEPMLHRPLHETTTALTDQFVLLHSLYWLIANLAEERPLVLIADDLQWGDELSLRFLLYLTQRLGDLPVTIVGAVRTGDPAAENELVARIALQASHTLQPTELSRDGVKKLLHTLLPDAGENDALVEESWTATRGNPFLLRELATAMISRSAVGTADPSGVVPDTAPESVTRSVMLRIARLGDDALALTRAVTVLGTSTSLTTAAELGGLDYADATIAAERLTAAQIFADEANVSFYHPMIRAAVYRKLPSHERGRLHLEAARVLLASDADMDEVAVHVMRGTPTDAEWAHSALHSAAKSAARKGAPRAAACYLRRALSMKYDDPRQHANLLIDLGIMEAAAGETNSLGHLEAALELIDEPEEQARAMHALGQTLFRYGRPAEALPVFRRGADTFTDRDRELALRFEAGYMASATYLADHPHEAHRRVSALAETFPSHAALSSAERLLVLHLGVFRAMSEPRSADHAELVLRALGDGVTLWRETSDGMTISHAILALTWCGRAQDAAKVAGSVLTDARMRGDSLIFAEISLARSMAMYSLGRVSEAMVDAQTAILGMKRGWNSTVPAPQGLMAYCLIDRGELEQAAEVVHDAETQLRSRETRTLNVWFYMARGRLRLVQGDYVGAADDFLRAGNLLEANGFHNPGYMLAPWRSLAGLALHAVGKTDAAIELMDLGIELAREFGLCSTLGSALRYRALIASPHPDIALLEESATVLESTEGSPLEMARTLIELGSAQRRAGRKVQSRETLRKALDLAHHSGATAVEQQAHQELLVSGARPRRPVLRGLNALTPSEQRIAGLLADGMTTRSIAETLYLTMSTVEWHRRNIYRKLNIDSREALRTALDDATKTPQLLRAEERQNPSQSPDNTPYY
ncbi:helix-turn-helix transcriptional regulator [Rhodococcus opacus]|uniref:helix-turn-helix transcriptional regulator n=1 Tax=Rhodococcus opacus TaxID=37919 RepID=UPI0022368594|nr:AAA family ATPase [Rhodococcus opacus]UZG60014.1 AAA family ATPase [Rhodococcus opacus]